MKEKFNNLVEKFKPSSSSNDRDDDGFKKPLLVPSKDGFAVPSFLPSHLKGLLQMEHL